MKKLWKWLDHEFKEFTAKDPKKKKREREDNWD